MEIHQIEAFIEVSKEHNFTKAAENLSVTQSTISLRIQKLESQLGVQLFHRKAGELKLSKFGEILLPLAEQCLQIMNYAKNKIEEEKEAANILRLGVTNPFAEFVLPLLMPDIYRTYSNYHIHVSRVGRSNEILRMLIDSKIDIAVANNLELFTDFPIRLFNSVPLYDSPIVLVGTPDHPLAQLSGIHVSLLSKQRFIFFHPSTISMKLIDRYLQTHSVTIPLTAYGNIPNLQVIKEIVRTEGILTLLPKLNVMEEIKTGVFKELPLTPPPPSLRLYLIASRSGKNLEIVDFIQKKVAALNM